MSKSSKRRSKPQAKTISPSKSKSSKPSKPLEPSPFANVKPGEMFMTMGAVMLRAFVVMAPLVAISLIASKQLPFLANPIAQVVVSLGAYGLFFNFIFGPMIKKGMAKPLFKRS